MLITKNEMLYMSRFKTIKPNITHYIFLKQIPLNGSLINSNGNLFSKKNKSCLDLIVKVEEAFFIFYILYISLNEL